jgi:hypothetical protein
LSDGDDAPEDHDGGEPSGWGDSLENDVAWNLTQSGLSVMVRWEIGLLELYLEQNVRNEESKECHVVIISRHIQVFGHALYLRVAYVGPVQEGKPNRESASTRGLSLCENKQNRRR